MVEQPLLLEGTVLSVSCHEIEPVFPQAVHGLAVSLYTAGHVFCICRLCMTFFQGGVLLHPWGLLRPLLGSGCKLHGSNHSFWLYFYKVSHWGFTAMHCHVVSTFYLMRDEGHYRKVFSFHLLTVLLFYCTWEPWLKSHIFSLGLLGNPSADINKDFWHW